MLNHYVENLPQNLHNYMSVATEEDSKRSKCLPLTGLIFKCVFTCLLYYVDMASDIYLIYSYHERKEMTNFYLSLGIMIFSVICVKIGLLISGTVFSCKVYRNQESSSHNHGDISVGKIVCFGLLFSVLCLTQMHILALSICYFVYEFKNREYADKREAVVFRKLILVLKMLEVYFESIPQYSLQTYIFFDHLFESGQMPIQFAIYPTKAPTPNTTINMDMPVNLFDTVTVTSRSLGMYRIQVFQIINVLLSAFSISMTSADYYFDAFATRIKIYKFISYFLQFTCRFMLCVFLFRIWRWPVFGVALALLIVDFLHIFKHNGDQLLKFPFLSVFNIFTLFFQKSIVSSSKYRLLAIMLVVVYFIENEIFVALFYFFDKELYFKARVLFTVSFSLAFFVATIFEILVIFDVNLFCCKSKCCCKK